MAAGGAATLVMSGLMLAAQKAGLMGRMPPRKITRGLLNRLGVRRTKRSERALSVAAHLGYGLGAGALFGAAVRGRLVRSRPMAEGVAFASALWGASYFGWVPALGLMAPPTRDRPDRTVAMIASHVVFGAVLGRLSKG